MGVLIVVAAGGGKTLLAIATIGLFSAIILGVVVLRAIWRAATRPVTGLDLVVAGLVWRRWNRRHPVPGPTWLAPYSGPQWNGYEYPPPASVIYPPRGALEQREH